MFFKRHLWNKIITVHTSINDVYAFSPIYFTASFPHFQVLRELWMSLAFSNRTLWTRFPSSTASILIQNRVKTFMKFYSRFHTFTVSRDMFQCIILIKMSNKGVFRNMYWFFVLSGKVMKIWILEFPPKQLSHQNWEASAISPKVFWKVARFFFSSLSFRTNGRENLNFHDSFLKSQNNAYRFLNLRHL